jgi:hypothetical protein
VWDDMALIKEIMQEDLDFYYTLIHARNESWCDENFAIDTAALFLNSYISLPDASGNQQTYKFDYKLNWTILDANATTVAERDTLIANVHTAMRNYLESRDDVMELRDSPDPKNSSIRRDMWNEDGVIAQACRSVEGIEANASGANFDAWDKESTPLYPYFNWVSYSGYLYETPPYDPVYN